MFWIKFRNISFLLNSDYLNPKPKQMSGVYRKLQVLLGKYILSGIK